MKIANLWEDLPNDFIMPTNDNDAVDRWDDLGITETQF